LVRRWGANSAEPVDARSGLTPTAAPPKANRPSGARRAGERGAKGRAGRRQQPGTNIVAAQSACVRERPPGNRDDQQRAKGAEKRFRGGCPSTSTHCPLSQASRRLHATGRGRTERGAPRLVGNLVTGWRIVSKRVAV